MARLSSKLRSIEGRDGSRGVSFWCPGCERAHAVNVGAGSPSWTWNGDTEQPTFAPSILIRIEWSKSIEPGDDPKEWQDEVCHSFVRSGQIEFLGDCTHSLAGQTVPIPDWPEPAT